MPDAAGQRLKQPFLQRKLLAYQLAPRGQFVAQGAAYLRVDGEFCEWRQGLERSAHLRAQLLQLPDDTLDRGLRPLGCVRTGERFKQAEVLREQMRMDA